MTDITNKLEENILHDAEMVVDKLTVIEREVTSKEGLFYMMKILPYRTSEDRINGVVITFYDITEIKKAEEQLRENLDELQRFNEAMVSRETRMVELKKEVNELCHRLQIKPPYPLDFEKEEQA